MKNSSVMLGEFGYQRYRKSPDLCNSNNECIAGISSGEICNIALHPKFEESGQPKYYNIPDLGLPEYGSLLGFLPKDRLAYNFYEPEEKESPKTKIKNIDFSEKVYNGMVDIMNFFYGESLNKFYKYSEKLEKSKPDFG